MKYILLFFLVSLNSIAQDTYVLVHGAWGGGWAWKEVANQLTEQGNIVYRPTLTGLGEKVHLASKEVNLSTHVQDVVNMILFEDLTNIVLMGHSYGGMVVTGVINAVPERVKRIIYLDAHLPKDGESVLADMTGGRSESLLQMEKDGFLIPAWLKDDQPLPHDVPHPLATLTEKIELKNESRLDIPGKYILTVDKGKLALDDNFYNSYVRAKEMGYATDILIADHNPQWSMPELLTPKLVKPD
ncbi:MAG: alpha/beta hydrolase [Cytophagales bacterium]|nr:alpha/beta hydrolase [Cytophagales bacterium]